MNNELFNRKYLKEFRRELRNNTTKAEGFLWKTLKGSQLNDRKRTEFLKSKGLKILRFENNEVFKNLDMVLEAIRSEFENNHP